MFLERLLLLCNVKHTDISNVLRALGLSTSKGTAWRNGSVPNGDILLKLAAYFGVSTDYLLGNTDDPTPAGKKEKPTREGELKSIDWDAALSNMTKDQLKMVIDKAMKKFMEADGE